MASSRSIFLILAFSYCIQTSLTSQSYRKELRTKNEVSNQLIKQLGHSIQSTRLDPSRVTQLSWRPRAFLYKGFLSDQECDHLISLAHGKLERSLAGGLDSGKNMNSNQLITSVTPLDIEQDDMVARIEDRVYAWTFLPKENSEHVEIMHDRPGETKQPLDYYGDKFGQVSAEPLMATVVLCLSNVTKGGETLFLESELKTAQPKDTTWSDCATRGYAIKPIKGSAILVFNLHLNTSPDESSPSARCPVVEGESWYATKFFHVRAIRKPLLDSDSNDCTDEDDNCSQWAATGECQKNPVYMIGTPDYYGSCQKSCRVC